MDDGIATGLTMRLAMRAVKAAGAERVVIAIPVAPPEILRLLDSEGAELVVLEPPEAYKGAVSAHYREFEQVRDAEVIELLESARGG